MLPGEEAEVARVGRRAFQGLESLMVGKPKKAMVAVSDNQIVGAIVYRFLGSGKNKIGYVDLAFVDREYHDRGVGAVLYRESIDFLWQQGCTAVTALVKDDNIGSWSLFMRYGLKRVDMITACRYLGPLGILRNLLLTPFVIADGMEFYLAVKEAKIPEKKGGVTQILLYILLNVLLFLPAFFMRDVQEELAAVRAYLTLLCAGTLAGLLVTTFHSRSWSFRMNNGGMLLTILLNMSGGAFPMIGNWYPKRYEKTISFRRDMGLCALAEWLTVLLLTAVPYLAGLDGPYFEALTQFGCIFLIYRILAFYPFESFGGRRVLNWNKGIYGIMAAVSAVLIWKC
ncbi:GNAT family N-acetyltransferase [Anaerolentibacter hominis]|uniref:GNAT family N-acetyltransferase n=1 Tax=Anaerolentibacter hominis TaxID=3079009 RepID=UPI0031B8146F